MPESVYICQGGCGRYEANPGQLVVRGVVTPRHYCAECAPLIDEYMMARDVLHSHVANEWSIGLAHLHAKFSVTDDKHPQGVKLPDG
jgi:hypothetical protein